MNFQVKSSKEIKKKIEDCKLALLPIGATEAHGPHLPLATDTILAERLAKKLASKIEAFVLPSIPYGQVWSLRDFPGSITVSNHTLISLLVDIGHSLYLQGFSFFVMINGHLGNQVAIKEAARVLYEKVPKLKVFYFFYPGMGEVVEEIRESERLHANYFHACEIETSIMLYLAEEFVKKDQIVDDMPTIPEEIDYTPMPWTEFSKTGVLGKASLATKSKGKKIVDRALSKMVHILQREVEQQRRQRRVTYD